MPGAVVEAIVHSKCIPLQLGLLCRVPLAEELMLPMALSNNLHLQQTMLRLPRLSPRVMAHLARSRHVEIRYELAQHPGLPVMVAEELATDASWIVREAAIRTGKLSGTTLYTLGRDSVKWVRLTATGKAPTWPWEHTRRDADFEAALTAR
jgi:hypothetical protein